MTYVFSLLWTPISKVPATKMVSSAWQPGAVVRAAREVSSKKTRFYDLTITLTLSLFFSRCTGARRRGPGGEANGAVDRAVRCGGRRGRGGRQRKVRTFVFVSIFDDHTHAFSLSFSLHRRGAGDRVARRTARYGTADDEDGAAG